MAATHTALQEMERMNERLCAAIAVGNGVRISDAQLSPLEQYALARILEQLMHEQQALRTLIGLSPHGREIPRG